MLLRGGARLVLLAFGVCLGHATLSAQSVGRSIRSVETLRISGSEHELSIVPWVVGYPDGRIAVGGPPTDGTVRWFDADGRPAGRFGRDGEGPGEFRTPAAAGRLGDTLWVLDRATSRVTLLPVGAAGNGMFTTISLPNRVEATGALAFPVVGTVSGLLPGRRLLFQGIEFGPHVRSPATSPRRLVATDSTGRVLAALPPLEPLGRCQVTYSAGKLKGSVGVFFCAQPIIRLGQAGTHVAVVASDNSTATQSTITVRLFTPEARLLFQTVLRVPAKPIPRHVIDSVQRGAIERAKSPEERAARRRAVIPPAYPPVTDVVLSEGGAVWLGTPAGTAQRQWIVLDARGIRQPDVLLPKSFRPVAVMGRDVLGTEVDPDDFIDIVRYRVGG
jgi:hypothetical protein